MNENNEFMERWKNERERGRVRYVLNENKVFLLVMSIVIIVIFSVGYIGQVYTGYTILTAQTVIKSLIIGSPTWIVPICSTFTKWGKNEKRYLELK